MTKMLAVAALLAGLVVPSFATPFLQHADLTPSNIQGELFSGAMRTNAGFGGVMALPIFYNNAPATAPWYRPSVAPLVVDWSSGGGNVQGGLGSVIDAGPQIIQGIEGIAGVFSPQAKASTVAFFNCSSSASACASISAGLFGNLNIEEAGKFSTTSKALFRHPVGEFLGPSLYFGGPKAN